MKRPAGYSQSSSCPGLSRASTFCCSNSKKGVDGRDKPGHDESNHAVQSNPSITPRKYPAENAATPGPSGT
jgi:hypothetical protein